MAKKESEFQRKLIKEIKALFPGCIVLKNDPGYLQGFPDLTILWKNVWAVLECKKGPNEVHQPNQDTYVEQCNNLSFSRFIYPENKEEVLNEMEQAFSVRR